MTQALNLANFANNLNSGGATSNAGLQNSAVTVTAGTGMSGGGSVSLGGTTTLTNAGVTSIVAGTGITISGATGAVTVTNSVAGGVTSLNGQTGAITETTLGVIGSVHIAIMYKTSTGLISGETIAGSSLYYPTSVATWMGRPQDTATLQSLSAGQGMFATPSQGTAQRVSNGNTGVQVPSGNVTTFSGTWRCMSSIVGQSASSRIACDSQTQTTYGMALFVRVS